MAGRTPPDSRRPFSVDFSPLRKLRKYRELSRKDLADAAGIDQVTLWRIETNRGGPGGRGNPSLQAVIALSRALGVPMYELFTIADAPEGQS